MITQEVILEGRERRVLRSDLMAYLVSGIMFPHLRKVFIKEFLVEGRLAHVYDLLWLAMLSIDSIHWSLRAYYDNDRVHTCDCPGAVVKIPIP